MNVDSKACSPEHGRGKRKKSYLPKQYMWCNQKEGHSTIGKQIVVRCELVEEELEAKQLDNVKYRQGYRLGSWRNFLKV